MSGFDGAVKVKRLPTLACADNASNTEDKGDSGEFDGQKFLDVTIDLEGETGVKYDPADS